MKWCAPQRWGQIESAAVPSGDRATAPTIVVPSRKVTLPFGTPPTAVTVAVSVNGEPEPRGVVASVVELTLAAAFEAVVWKRASAGSPPPRVV